MTCTSCIHKHEGSTDYKTRPEPWQWGPHLTRPDPQVTGRVGYARRDGYTRQPLENLTRNCCSVSFNVMHLRTLKRRVPWKDDQWYRCNAAYPHLLAGKPHDARCRCKIQ